VFAAAFILSFCIWMVVMPVSQTRTVLKGPYFFRSFRFGCGPPGDHVHRVELFVGDVLPTTVAFLRVVGQQARAGHAGDFFGFVSKSKDGVQGRAYSLSSRSSTLLVIGHISLSHQLSWLAPAPWNYSPITL
jgi:hypothetical protein